MLKRLPDADLSLLYPSRLPSRCCRPRCAGGDREDGFVDRYNNHDWIAAFKQAFAEGDTVVVPAGLTCENINTGIFIPDGKTLLIRGALKGNGRGRFVPVKAARSLGKERGTRITLRWTCVAPTVSLKGWR